MPEHNVDQKTADRPDANMPPGGQVVVGDVLSFPYLKHADVGLPEDAVDALSGEAIDQVAVRKLEALDGHIDVERKGYWELSPRDKADALLAAVGAKPAALTFSMGGPFDADEPYQAPEDSSAEYVEILRELGLKVSTSLEVMDARPDLVRPDVPRRIGVRLVYMSRTDEGLQNIVEAGMRQDKRGIGLALGYPRTSVDAFISGDRTFASNVADGDLAVGAFNFFTLSSDHHEEELAVAAEWADTVRRISPTIYDAAVSKHAVRNT